jgi:hypothetical protein
VERPVNIRVNDNSNALSYDLIFNGILCSASKDC